jgi:hypothetical protein
VVRAQTPLPRRLGGGRRGGGFVVLGHGWRRGFLLEKREVSFFFIVLRGKWEGILNEWSRGRWKDSPHEANFLKIILRFS